MGGLKGNQRKLKPTSGCPYLMRQAYLGNANLALFLKPVWLKQYTGVGFLPSQSLAQWLHAMLLQWPCSGHTFIHCLPCITWCANGNIWLAGGCTYLASVAAHERRPETLAICSRLLKLSCCNQPLRLHAGSATFDAFPGNPKGCPACFNIGTGPPKMVWNPAGSCRFIGVSLPPSRRE